MKNLTALLLFSLVFTSQAQIADSPENVRPLLIGEKIPNIELANVEGKKMETDKILSKKTVLVVYRGGWCPYCNSQLADMQEIEKDILEFEHGTIRKSIPMGSFDTFLVSENEIRLNSDDLNPIVLEHLHLTVSEIELTNNFLKSYIK